MGEIAYKEGHENLSDHGRAEYVQRNPNTFGAEIYKTIMVVSALREMRKLWLFSIR